MLLSEDDSILYTLKALVPFLMLLSFTSSMSGRLFMAQRKLAFHVLGSGRSTPGWYFPKQTQKEKFEKQNTYWLLEWKQSPYNNNNPVLSYRFYNALTNLNTWNKIMHKNNFFLSPDKFTEHRFLVGENEYQWKEEAVECALQNCALPVCIAHFMKSGASFSRSQPWRAACIHGIWKILFSWTCWKVAIEQSLNKDIIYTNIYTLYGQVNGVVLLMR